MPLPFVQLSNVEPRKPRWIWPDRIPVGAITLLQGDPAAGKSTLLCDIVARLTTGTPMFQCQQAAPRTKVLILAAEDDAATTIVPRLQAASADRELVRAIDSESAASQIRFPEALPDLEREIIDDSCGLVIIDPFKAFLDGSSNSESAVRRVLSPLCSLARRCNTAILLVNHLTKSTAGSPLYRGSGSIAINAVARSVLLLGRDPTEPNRSVLAQVKNSFGPQACSLAFAQISAGPAARLEWIGENPCSPEDLLSPSRNGEGSALAEAVYALFSILGNGPVPAKTARGLARNAGITDATLRRAKTALGVLSKRKGFGRESTFYWCLADEHPAVQELRERELSNLFDDLTQDGREDDDYDDPADWWKG